MLYDRQWHNNILRTHERQNNTVQNLIMDNFPKGMIVRYRIATRNECLFFVLAALLSSASDQLYLCKAVITWKSTNLSSFFLIFDSKIHLQLRQLQANIYLRQCQTPTHWKISWRRRPRTHTSAPKRSFIAENWTSVRWSKSLGATTSIQVWKNVLARTIEIGGNAS